ncbi:MAG: pilus assembly protein, partial [Anaerolineales bacterium]|nr:pilus assembly protein [Anaerolineales bacterium]
MKTITLFRKTERCSRSDPRKSAGQAAVEFALILPVLLALLFGIIELARMFQSYLVVTNAARFGMRYAVTGQFDQALCDSMYIDLDGDGTYCDGDSRNEEIDIARVYSAYAAARGVMGSIRMAPVSTDPLHPERSDVAMTEPSAWNITVCSNRPIGSTQFIYMPPTTDICVPPASPPTDWSLITPWNGSDWDDAGDPSQGRHTVTVAVTYRHELLIPVPFFNVDAVTLHARRGGVLEQFRAARVVELPGGDGVYVPTLPPPPTPTVPTNTPTNTATATATPACSLITIANADMPQWGFFEVDIENQNDADGYLTNTQLSWMPAANPGKFVDEFLWRGSGYYSGDSTDAIVTQASTYGSQTLYHHSTSTWRGDFDDGSDFYGDFQVDFTFEFDDGLTCPLSATLQIATPTPSPTPDCSLYTLDSVQISSNRFLAQVSNGSNQETYYNHIEIDWQFVYDYMDAVGYPGVFIDWVKLEGNRIPYGNDIHDYSSPTEIDGNWLFPANNSDTIDVDFDFPSEFSDAFDTFGLETTDVGWTINLANGCDIVEPRVDRPIATPTPPVPPSCTNLTAGDPQWNGDDWEVQFYNNDPYSPAMLVEQTVTWPAATNPGMVHNYSRFDGTTYNESNSSSSPITYTNTDPMLRILQDDNVLWENDFDSAPAGYPGGYWSGEFVFEYPNGLQCPLFVEDDIPVCPENGTGLRGEYYGDMNLNGFVFARIDPVVDFNWDYGNPGGGLPSNNFSVRWEGQVEPQFTETYTFYTNTDDGVRLWVNGVQLVNAWWDSSATTRSGQITLQACQLYDIEMEYYENGGGAVAQLGWESASQSPQIIPQEDLYPATDPLPPTVTPTVPPTITRTPTIT